MTIIFKKLQELDYRLLRHNKAPISSFDTKIDNRQADHRRETRNRHIQFLKTELPSLFDEKKMVLSFSLNWIFISNLFPYLTLDITTLNSRWYINQSMNIFMLHDFGVRRDVLMWTKIINHKWRMINLSLLELRTSDFQKTLLNILRDFWNTCIWQRTYT